MWENLGATPRDSPTSASRQAGVFLLLSLVYYVIQVSKPLFAFHVGDKSEHHRGILEFSKETPTKTNLHIFTFLVAMLFGISSFIVDWLNISLMRKNPLLHFLLRCGDVLKSVL